MTSSARVLLIAGPETKRTPAFDRAMGLARAMGLPLHIMAIDFFEALMLAGYLDSEHVERACNAYVDSHRQWLDEQAHASRHLGITTTVEVVWTRDAFEAVREFVIQNPVAMIIKDAHPEALVRRIFYSPLDWRLLRDLPTPVHLVTGPGAAVPKHIAACIDLLRSEAQDVDFNDHIVTAAVKLAEQCDAQLQLLHVFDWSAAFMADAGMSGMPLDTGLYTVLSQAQHQAFQALADRHGVPEDRRYFLDGLPVQSIDDFVAAKRIDALVIGTLRQHGIKRRIGSTAERLLAEAPCSLLAVKPDEVSGWNELIA
ncbi:universal stress protein [Pseudomonas sp. TE3610]